MTGQTGPNLPVTVPIPPDTQPPPPFPITASAFQPVIGGNDNAFVTKLSASGSSFLYSSYLGGDNEDIAYGIAVDGTANAYVTGLTYSVTFPVTGSALQPANAGAGDAWFRGRGVHRKGREAHEGRGGEVGDPGARLAFA